MFVNGQQVFYKDSIYVTIKKHENKPFVQEETTMAFDGIVDLTVRRSSSASGCAIFEILPFNNLCFNSLARLATTIPSKAIVVSSVYYNLIYYTSNVCKWSTSLL